MNSPCSRCHLAGERRRHAPLSSRAFFSRSRVCTRFLSHSYVCRALSYAAAIATAGGNIGRSGISAFSLIIPRSLALSFVFPRFLCSFAAVVSGQAAFSSALAFTLSLVRTRDKNFQH